MATDKAVRERTYRELFKHHLPNEDVHRIRESLTHNYPLGNDRFREEIETALGRSVGKGKRGRPVRQE